MAKPIFRKTIFPWYYAKVVQILIILLGLAIMFFAFIGLLVAGEYESGAQFIWVPLVLLVGAAVLVIIAIVRLKRTFSQKPSGFIDFK